MAYGEDQKIILVVEDEPVSAMDFCDRLRDQGYVVDGPYADNALAMQAIERCRPDAAVLDYSLRHGDNTESTAMRLAELGVPFVFLTGCVDTTMSSLTSRYGVDMVPKPVGADSLIMIAKSLIPDNYLADERATD